MCSMVKWKQFLVWGFHDKRFDRYLHYFKIFKVSVDLLGVNPCVLTIALHEFLL